MPYSALYFTLLLPAGDSVTPISPLAVEIILETAPFPLPSEPEDEDDEKTKNEEYEEDSYITEGVKGIEETPEQKFSTMKSVLNHYARA